MSSVTAAPLPLPSKAALLIRIWYWYARIRHALREGNLVEVVNKLGDVDGRHRYGIAPARLGRIVDRALPLSLTGATCLAKSLVLFRLLHWSGFEPELVVGLPATPANHEAHAWDEIEGVDVGPPPGGAGFTVLARYRAR